MGTRQWWGFTLTSNPSSNPTFVQSFHPHVLLQGSPVWLLRMPHQCARQFFLRHLPWLLPLDHASRSDLQVRKRHSTQESQATKGKTLSYLSNLPPFPPHFLSPTTVYSKVAAPEQKNTKGKARLRLILTLQYHTQVQLFGYLNLWCVKKGLGINSLCLDKWISVQQAFV